jgi:hypothetical protein
MKAPPLLFSFEQSIMSCGDNRLHVEEQHERNVKKAWTSGKKKNFRCWKEAAADENFVGKL